MKLHGQGLAVDERWPVAADHQAAQLHRTVAMSVKDCIARQEVGEFRHAFGKPRMERGGGERLPHGLFADGTKLHRPALGEVLELERTQPGNIGGVRRNEAFAMDLRGRVPVFADDASELQVVAERDRGEIDVALAAFHAVDAGRFQIAPDVRQRPDRHAVHAAIVWIQSVEALAPQAVASAQRFISLAEGRIG